MKKGKDNICLLTLESRTERGRSKGIRRDNNRTELVSEAIPALFLLIGILSMCRDMDWCLMRNCKQWQLYRDFVIYRVRCLCLIMETVYCGSAAYTLLRSS